MIVSMRFTLEIVHSKRRLKTALLLAAVNISPLSNSPSPF